MWPDFRIEVLLMFKLNHPMIAEISQIEKEEKRKYVYQIELDTIQDVKEFNRIATSCKGSLYIIGKNMKVDARSLLGTHVASMAWDELYLEADFDCYQQFKQFIL